MSLETTGIDHINLQVRNLEESCRFWKNLLGFEVLEDMPELKGKIIGNEKAKLALYEEAEFDCDNSGFNHVSFHIKDFDTIEDTCKKLGIVIKYDGVVDWPESRSIYIDDPNGYEIELAEYWGGKL